MTDPMYDDEWDEQYESGAAPLVALEEQADAVVVPAPPGATGSSSMTMSRHGLRPRLRG